MVYPHGDSEANGEYLSLFVALASEGRHVPAYYTFTLVDQSGGGADMVQGRTKEQGPCRFEQRGWWVGFRRYAPRAPHPPGGVGPFQPVARGPDPPRSFSAA